MVDGTGWHAIGCACGWSNHFHVGTPATVGASQQMLMCMYMYMHMCMYMCRLSLLV